MWPLTGHCAYSLECERWRQRCGRCPHMDVYFPIRFDCSRLNLWRRKRVYQQIARELPGRLQFVSPSEWLADIARHSVACDLPVHVIPNGIDTHTFRPLDPARHETVRREWGVPDNAVVVLFAANKGGKNLFKDYDTFIDAARQALDKNPSLFFVAAGGDKGPRTEQNGLPVLGLGHIASPEVMAETYGVADIFVHATRADNLPLAPLEAMACGTPCIGSRIGGVPEVIMDGETGLLCEGGNAGDMASAILRMVESAELRHAYAQAGIARVQSRFTREIMVDAYLALYEQVLQRSNPGKMF
jgi:glycosyltransferase involved in cell wall biosynthesis